VRRRCAADADCCSGLCDPASGRCVCGPGTDECGGDCIPLDQYQSDVENCGSCRTRCRQAPACQMPACLAGACGSVPDPDQVGQPCGRGGEVCAEDGACVCPSHLPTACRQGCVDTTTDPDNCGACDNRCPRTANGTAVCGGGVCGIACDAGFTLCGEQCCADGRDCCNGDCCGPNQCCAAEGCVPCFCSIGIDRYEDGEVNPSNACQYCDPTRDQDDWTTASDGTFCGEGRVCCNGECCSPSECCDGVQCTSVNCPDQCEILGQPVEAGVRNEANNCQECNPDLNRFDWTLVDDNTSCGGVPGRVCCNGECCSPTECCNPAGFCEECGPHCRIGDEDVPKDDVNPADPCQLCNPDADFDDWSTAPDDTECGIGRYCCAGECCPSGQCCNDGACGACVCTIGDDEFERDDVNPFNACQVCNPDRDREGWSPGPPNTDCGLFNDRFCCAGDCCPADECCNAIGECETCGCVISGEPVLEDAVNPANTCQVCDPGRDRRAWTVLDDGEDCGTDADDRVCCAGICCPQGQCCVGGACQDCGCEIDGVPIAPGTINEDNPCQKCDPSRARLAWSPLDNGTSCGADGAACCGGECCAGDQCCILDACGECLCAIGDDNVTPETRNPDNLCEICDPKRDPFGWSTAPDRSSCGDDQVCCAGACCDPGLCCVLGICQFCGCRIGEADIPEFALNPENECEWCDPVLDPFGWSPRSDEPCGVDQVCCGGICCADGECCGLDDVCAACDCEIDGVFHDAGTVNTANSCEICDPTKSTTAWTPLSDDTPCGEHQVCCAGVCCGVGNCCTGIGTCLACRCVIEGIVFEAGVTNPANGCEVCDPLVSTTAWSPAIDESPCADAFGQICCGGICCPEGQCCQPEDRTCGPCRCTIDEVEYIDGDHNPVNDCEVCTPALDPSGWSLVPDNLACGDDPDRVCCRGVCCADGDCCHIIDGLCGPEPCHCTIGEEEIAEGEPNPANECERCDPTEDPSDWSPLPDDSPCGESGTQVCCLGTCCAPGNCCTLGVCGLCGCLVDGVNRAEFAINPDNECEWCDPALDPFAWSPRSDEPCGDGQVCCGGVCCQPGWCCGPNGICDIEFCGDPCFQNPESCVCEIDGVSYPNGTVNPTNACQVCSWHASPTSWSNVRDDAPCGPSGEQYCCQGVCCAAGECCTNDGNCATGGASVCDGCDIDGRFYPIAMVNPANECEFCAPRFSTTAWSPRDNHATCGDGHERNCCDGICCAAGLCCTAPSVGGVCEPCGCDIDGGSYVAGQINPANWCQVCDPERSTTAWSISDVTFCEIDFSRDCCNGVCCSLGTCCGFSGVCEPMEPDVSNCVNWQF
jgi:hypothetical protein